MGLRVLPDPSCQQPLVVSDLSQAPLSYSESLHGLLHQSLEDCLTRWANASDLVSQRLDSTYFVGKIQLTPATACRLELHVAKLLGRLVHLRRILIERLESAETTHVYHARLKVSKKKMLLLVWDNHYPVEVHKQSPSNLHMVASALQIDFSKLGEQPEVHLTYRHIASTIPAEHGTDQVLCKLKLTGNVRDGMLLSNLT